jgi:hypothetical protein
MRPGNLVKRIVSCVLIVCLPPLLTGCQGFKDHTLTGQLWDNDMLCDHYQPATNAQVSLFDAPAQKDVLVQYLEEREKNGATKPRAYLLLLNQSRVAAGKKPRFASRHLAGRLTPIPLAVEGATNGMPSVWAKLSPDGQGFTIVRDGTEIGCYHLPTYMDQQGQVKRLLLTPGTVVVDVAVGVAIVAVIVGVAYVSGSAH